MTKRSLKASPSGIEQAKKAFERKGWTQEYLAAEVGLQTRQSIWKFFSGRPIERHIFIDICQSLDLDWAEIAGLTGESLAETESNPQAALNTGDIPSLVTAVREALTESILKVNSTINLLETGHPVPLDDIYIEQKIYPIVRGQTWLDITELNESIFASKSAQVNPLDRLDYSLSNSLKPQMNSQTISAMSAVESCQKLLILGKPGSGKTTLLKYLSLCAIRQQLPSSQIPLFISIRRWIQRVKHIEELKKDDLSFLAYLRYKYGALGINPDHLEILLKQGQILILLDGLDQVNQETRSQVIKAITSFAETYDRNQFIITCRLGALHYHIPGFDTKELADFSEADIQLFAQKWFVLAADNHAAVGLEKSRQFLEKLALPENQSLRGLGMTPILLKLLAIVFNSQNNFSEKIKHKIYEAALDIFLFENYESALIQRDEPEINWSRNQKIKLLSQIAFYTFESGKYFFEKRELISYIYDQLSAIKSGETDAESLREESEVVLNLIEMHHGLLVERAKGIYSFSHLTFHEYFAARYLANISDSIIFQNTLTRLSAYGDDYPWGEVLGLLKEMVPNVKPILEQ